MEKKPKVLVISYYWYPFAGVGTYRVSRFVKYLQRLGWEVVVLTAKKASSGHRADPDDSLLARVKVYRSSIIEPTQLLSNKNSGNTSVTHNPSIFYSKNKGLLAKIAVWMRLNILIPDAKLTWKWFAVPLGKKVIKQEAPDIIFSTSPPPTTHRIAQQLASWSKIPWLADFRDPWTNIYYYDDNPLSPLAQKKNKELENQVLHSADRITVVNYGFFDKIPDSLQTKIHRITNGFDPDHITIEERKPQRNEQFTIRYFGSLKINQRPTAFLEALSQIENETPEIAQRMRFEFFGSLDPTIGKDLESICDNITFNKNAFIQHSDMMALLPKSDLLLLSIGSSKNSSYALSTKVFEYMISGSNVLGIGPIQGAAAEVVSSTGIGQFFDRTDGSGVYSYIMSCFEAFDRNEYTFNDRNESMEKYSFNKLSQQLDSTMKDLIR